MPKKEKKKGVVVQGLSWLWDKIKDGASWTKDAWVDNVWKPHLKQPWKDNIAKPFKDNIGKPFKKNVWKPLKKNVGPFFKSASKSFKHFGQKVRDEEAKIWQSNFLLGLSVFFAGCAAGGGIYVSVLLAQAIAAEYVAGIFIYGFSLLGGVGMFSILSYKSFEASSEGNLNYYLAWHDKEAKREREIEKEKNKGKGKEKDGKEGKEGDMRAIGSDKGKRGVDDDPMDIGRMVAEGSRKSEANRQRMFEEIARTMPDAVAPGVYTRRTRARDDDEHSEDEGLGRGGGKVRHRRNKRRTRDVSLDGNTDE